MKNIKISVYNQLQRLTLYSLFISAVFTASLFSQVPAPYNLNAAAVSSSKINLTWQASGPGIVGFEINRKIEGSNNFIFISNVNFPQTTYLDHGLQPNTKYYYRVRSIGPDSTFSAYSNIDSARTFQDSIINGIPLPPSNLSALAVSSTKIRLHWNDNSNNETGFKIFRGILDSAIIWTYLATVNANTVTYYDEGLQPNHLYFYRLYAFNSYGNSVFSNTAGAITYIDTTSINPPIGATGVSITPLLTWGPVMDELTNYSVEIATDENFNSVVLTQNNISQAQYQVPAGVLNHAMHYYWKVKVTPGGGISYYLGLWNFSTGLTSIKQISSEIPSVYSLEQNYPNPFNPSTKIVFHIPVNSYTKLIVYDITGKIVAVAFDGMLSAGKFEVDFDASNYSSGIYFYKIQSGSFTDTKKMILIK